jgi:hypothetical protein
MSVLYRLYENGVITITPLHRSFGTPKGNKGSAKTFKIDSKRKRLIQCSAIRMFLTKKFTIKWGALTFSAPVDEKEANKCLSRFIDNLKLNYNVKSYIFVKELHKSGNPHYHFLFDMPFVDFRRLNRAWCLACSDIMPFSNNAFTTGRKPIVKDIKGIVNYITKYITKANEAKLSKSRNYFIDHSTLSKSKLIGYNDYVYLITKFKSNTVFKDHFTIVYLKNFYFLPEKIIRTPIKKIKTPKKIPDFLPINFKFWDEIPEKRLSIHDLRM